LNIEAVSSRANARASLCRELAKCKNWILCELLDRLCARDATISSPDFTLVRSSLMKIRQYSRVIFIEVVVLGPVRMLRLAAQEKEGKPIVGPASAAKFGSIPNAPEFFTVAVERGDPSKGPSVILAKFAPGCVAPFHWHTPSETVISSVGHCRPK